MENISTQHLLIKKLYNETNLIEAFIIDNHLGYSSSMAEEFSQLMDTKNKLNSLMEEPSASTMSHLFNYIHASETVELNNKKKIQLKVN